MNNNRRPTHNRRQGGDDRKSFQQRKAEEQSKQRALELEQWIPKTGLGKKVKNKEIISMEEVLKSGEKILESQIVDILLPNLEVELLSIGQSKGKFGGGKKSIWKQTQKKTKEGNKPRFSSVVVVGNRDGFVGVGHGKAKETLPAREKATRQAKLNLISIRRGCGSWACGCKESHSVPYKVRGKISSVIVELMPAPRGTRLTVNKECQKILELAGITDVYSKTFGQTKSTLNLVVACFRSLKSINKLKLSEDTLKKTNIIEGIKA